ncbi:hypothetical protein DMUE_4750, partial [Dictyocoela muelleri]
MDYNDFANLTFYSDIFIDINKTLDFLLHVGVLTNNKLCRICNAETLILIRTKTNPNRGFYRCKICKTKMTLNNGFLKRSRVSLNILLRIIYTFTANFDIVQIEITTGLSKNTIIAYRKMIIEQIKNSKDQLFGKIGGPGIKVQIDETAICRGKIIINPSSTLDDDDEIQWLVGGIEETEEKIFFLVIVPNREVENIYGVLENNVLPGSIIITDEFSSYPRAVRMFGSEHKIVPHNQGFV